LTSRFSIDDLFSIPLDPHRVQTLTLLPVPAYEDLISGDVKATVDTKRSLFHGEGLVGLRNRKELVYLCQATKLAFTCEGPGSTPANIYYPPCHGLHDGGEGDY
jgi:hypothetical protein